MFNEKLKELRKQKGVTQEELANSIFVSREAVSKWEQGRGLPSDVNLEEISKYFNVSIDELITKDDLKEQIKESEKKNKFTTKVSFIISLICLLLIIVIILLTIHLNKKDTPQPQSQYVIAGCVIVPDGTNSLLDIKRKYIDNPFGGIYEIPECDNIISVIDGIVNDNYELQNGDLIRITFNDYSGSLDEYPGEFKSETSKIECIGKNINFEYIGNAYHISIPQNDIDNIERLLSSKLIKIEIDNQIIEVVIENYNDQFVTFSISLSNMHIFLPNYDKANISIV